MNGADGEILYREFVPGDEFLLAALIEEVFGQFVAAEFCPDEAAAFLQSQEPKFIYLRFLYGKIFIIVAQEKEPAKYLPNHGVAGFIEVQNHGHISFLFVRKERQGQGVAKRLLAEAVKKCRAANPSLTGITLNSTLYARPIYEKLGFKKADRPFGCPPKNSIPMVLQLQKY